MKVNLDKIIDRNEKKEVVISKYNDSGSGISTELDINLRENNSPEFSILGVREILGFDSGNIFTQFSAFNHERFNNKSSY